MIDVAEGIRNTINNAKPRLLALDEAAAGEKPHPDKWSLKEIIGHLIDSASNNHQRIVRMQELADIGTFRYSQQHWVSSQYYQERPWRELVDLWYAYNLHLAHIIGHVDPSALEHGCDVGYAKPATLRFVIEDYLRHVTHHLEQVFAGTNPRERSRWERRDPTQHQG